jgi:hypothetical protein
MLRMDRRSLLKGLVAAPLAKPLAALAPVVAAPVAVAQPLDATLTALASLSWSNGRVIFSHNGDGTFSWANTQDATRW